MKLDTLEFLIQTKPTQQQRHRFSKEFGHAYDPSAKDKRSFRNLVILELKKLNLQESPFHDKPIEVTLVFGFIKPKTQQKRQFHTVTPDIDNLAKFVLDACNTLLYRDDSLITDLIASKVYSDSEFVKIIVKEKAPNNGAIQGI